MGSDTNIVTLEAADYAAFYIYVIKFLSKHGDKNLITFPTDDKNIVTFPIKFHQGHLIVMIPAGKGSHVELGIALGTGKKIYLYSSTNELNEIGNTCTFYHVDSVEQRIGSLDDLINSVCLEYQHH